MGGDLPATKSKAPTFIVWAVKDPDDANLDRIQIVKGWTRNGQIFEKIYNVAWSNNRKRERGGESIRTRWFAAVKPSCRPSATPSTSRTRRTPTPSVRSS